MKYPNGVTSPTSPKYAPDPNFNPAMADKSIRDDLSSEGFTSDQLNKALGKSVQERMSNSVNTGQNPSPTSQIPASKPAATSGKAPYADGTKVTGPDGKLYVIQDGMPQLVQDQAGQ